MKNKTSGAFCEFGKTRKAGNPRRGFQGEGIPSGWHGSVPISWPKRTLPGALPEQGEAESTSLCPCPLLSPRYDGGGILAGDRALEFFTPWIAPRKLCQEP